MGRWERMAGGGYVSSIWDQRAEKPGDPKGDQESYPPKVRKQRPEKSGELPQVSRQSPESPLKLGPLLLQQSLSLFQSSLSLLT
jgi:hypothetical protein